MSASALENEDIENVPLVRMEDIQPSRDKVYELVRSKSGEELLETCVIDNIEYDNECVVSNDDDSNIGSMVSICSEETLEEPEIIVPDIINEIPIEFIPDPKKTPSSWPTLEILPGGVIKKPEKPRVPRKRMCQESASDKMTYACAKCSQEFKFLFCLVKHVKGHEDEEKKKIVSAMVNKEVKPYNSVQPKKKKIILCMKSYKKKAPKKMKS